MHAGGADRSSHVQRRSKVGVMRTDDANVESTLVGDLDKIDCERNVDPLLLRTLTPVRPLLRITERPAKHSQVIHIRARLHPGCRLSLVRCVRTALATCVRKSSVDPHLVQHALRVGTTGVPDFDQPLTKLPRPEVSRSAETAAGATRHVLVVDEHRHPSSRHGPQANGQEKARQSPRGGRAGMAPVCRSGGSVASTTVRRVRPVVVRQEVASDFIRA